MPGVKVQSGQGDIKKMKTKKSEFRVNLEAGAIRSAIPTTGSQFRASVSERDSASKWFSRTQKSPRTGVRSKSPYGIFACDADYLDVWAAITLWKVDATQRGCVTGLNSEN